MAARGNRVSGVGRFGVAFLATAAFGLASLQPAFAESAPTPPPEATNADTTDAPPTPPAPPTESTESQPAPAEPTPTPAPTPPPADPPADSNPTPPADGDGPDTAEPAPDDAAETETKPAEQPSAETKPTPAPTPAPKDAVKLEPAPASPPAAATAPAAAPPAAAAATAAPTTVVILIQDAPAQAPGADSEAAKTEAALAAAAIVSFRPRPAAGPISLLPATETAATAPRKARAVPAARKPLTRHACARPVGRVPLSEKCKQVRAVAGAQVTLNALQSLPEVRAAIARGAPPRVTIRRDEARPPPKSKAAKKRPIAEVRPIIPFGDSGQGVSNDGFNGSTASSSSSRLFALAVVPLRVPWPFRFARLRLPSTLPHGVIPAPPSARPG